MNKVYESIHAISKELAMCGLDKSQKNSNQGWRFRGIDDVLNILAPLLVRHNLCILPRCKERTCTKYESKGGGTMFNSVVKVEYDFISTEDGSKHVVETYGEGMATDDKATPKAMSCAYKYAAFQAFCIPIEGTPDADSETHEVVTEQVQAKQSVQTKSADPVVGGKKKLGKETATSIQQNILGAMAQKADCFPSPEHIGDTVKVALEKHDYTHEQFSRLMQPLRYEWYRLACINSDSEERDKEIVDWLHDDMIRSQIGEKGADELLKCMSMQADESCKELGKLAPSYR